MKLSWDNIFFCTMTNHHLIYPPGGFYFLLIGKVYLTTIPTNFISEYNSITITRQQCLLTLQTFIERIYVAATLNS